MLCLFALAPFVLAGLQPAKHAFGFDQQALAEANYVTQPQDHFDSKNKQYWQQAYYTNADYWDKSSSSPVFVYIGGEVLKVVVVVVLL